VNESTTVEGARLAARDTDAIVIETTSAKVRKFLYELAEGTTDYRSLHSLTEQVEHQYHGRFIVELIQNAHDALLSRTVEAVQSGRIEILLRDEGEFGVLYVANDGRPFSASNFESLSQLGQSDKNPQESIGNKGIGFRSVLEITGAPEIYSRSAEDSPHFDGFCFGFSPEVIRRLDSPARALLDGDDAVSSPFGQVPLVDWDSRLLAKFRANVARLAGNANLPGKDWLTREMAYLSPYLLPFPLQARERGTLVTEFESRGFATLIRFPLKSAASFALVREKLDELDNSALLFLEKASSLVLDSVTRRRELLRRQTARPNGLLGGRAVTISDGSDNDVQHYWVWTRNIALADVPDKVRAAVQQLPGKWPQLREVAVSIGVRLGEEPQSGALSIFLPTLLRTGCGAHINAPFFGDMSRTVIDFGSDDDQGSSSGAVYNRFLLLEAARFAVSVVNSELSGQDVVAARAAVDLLAPWGSEPEESKRWQRLTASAAEEAGTDVKTAAWCLSDCGWGALQETSLLPVVSKPLVIAPQVLRKHAAFPTYVDGLESRRDLIEALSKEHGVGAYPADEDLAATIESIARGLHEEGGANWNGFWADVDGLLGGDCSSLTARRVLLGNDGQLHIGGGEDSTVFFIPRQGASDDEDIENDSDVKDIPETLRPFVAFLSEHIQVYEEKAGRLQQTRIRKVLLDSKLVSRFRREDILNDVLIAKTPSLPVAHSGAEARLCRDILLWGLRLMSHLVDRSKGDKSLRLLRTLPVPCLGGWYPLAEAAFGPGWPGTQGAVTANYLARIDTTESRSAWQRLLLPPSDERWGGNGYLYFGLLSLVGVFDGLRLVSIDPKAWNSRFTATKGSFQLPESVPPGLLKTDWDDYRKVAQKDARPQYNWGKYEFQRLHLLPGLEKYRDFDKETRIAFMEVVLGSAGHWDGDWGALSVNRVEGNCDSLSLVSPLLFVLRGLSWIGLIDGDDVEWCRPAARWHVPALELARGRRWQFAHLFPLPGELANRLDTDSSLAAVMKRLGMPRFDPEAKSASTQLLDALADAVLQERVPHWDVFLGQVRSAWRGFDPAEGSAFPRLLLVQRGSSRLIAQQPDQEHPIYLPDSAKSFLAALKHFELPVIAIEIEDAKRLADRFTAAFPGGVLRASNLQPVPLVEGLPWSDVPQERMRENTELEWVIPVLLTIAAFHGPQSQGAASKAFRKHLEAFRDARVGVVGKVETGLFQGELPVAPPLPVPALWLSSSQTLLLSDVWKEDMASLSEALANILEREDLEVPIKLVLGITGAQPEHQVLIRALEQLKLSEEHFRDVREHWRGDLGQIIEMLVPLLTILKPEANIGELVELDTDEAVMEFLDHLQDERLDGKTLVRMARESSDMFEFGSRAFDLFGDAVQMSHWNGALSRRDEPPLVNSGARDAFKAHIAATSQVLRSVLAGIVDRRTDGGSYSELASQLDALTCPDKFETDFWDVSYKQALAVVISLLRQWQASADEIAAFRDAASKGELIDRLAAAGVDVTFDPIQAARDNRERLRRALIQLQQIGLAWALESGYPNPADWESRVEGYLDSLAAAVEASVFTRVWRDEEIWALLQTLPVDAASATFWTAIAAVSNFDELVGKLSIPSDALANAKAKLDALREDARRRKKAIEVCGKEFDGSDDNFSALWAHICAGLPTDVLSELAPVDLKKTSSLEEIVPRPATKPKEKEPKNKPKQKHLSKAMENLIGLSGEIHAFRMLQRTYGESSVSATSWVSENSLYVFPDNKADDDRGCDFIVTLPERTYFVEVKSSEGDQESFTLGSSQIRLAMQLAKKSRRRRRESFVVLRIANALTTAPSFQLLPNPYDQRYQSQFEIEDADARVRYRSKA
jgi:hypothetical protein